MSKLTEINIFAKEDGNASKLIQTKSKFRRSKTLNSQCKKVRSGYDSGIESIGMSSHLLKKFNKGVAVSTSMIIKEISDNVKLKLEILELKHQLKREKKANNFKKVSKLKILIRRKKLLYHKSKILRPKGIY